MARTYPGNPPDLALGWELAATLDIPEDGGLWRVYRQRQAHSETWANYKIVADQPVSDKANYWFAMNTANGHIGFGRDVGLLRMRRTTLYGALLELLAKEVAK